MRTCHRPSCLMGGDLMAGKNGFIAYHDHVNHVRDLLNDDEAGRLFFALSAYSETGELPPAGLSKAWNACFKLLSGAIDKDAAKYEETCRRNRENAYKRWEDASACDGIPVDTRAQKNNATAYDRNENGSDGMRPYAVDANRTESSGSETNPSETTTMDRRVVWREPTEHIPPTREEVATYCQDNGYQIDVDTFYTLYTERHWMAGGAPIKSWKALVVQWHKSILAEKEKKHATV